MFEKNIVSIDLGSENIKIVIGSAKGENIKISEIAMIEIPSNAYLNGKINDLDQLRSAIRKQLDIMGVKKRWKAVLTLDSADVITREVELPYSKDINLSSIVRFELEDSLPIMLDEYIIESKILETFDEGPVKKYRVLAALMPKEMADHFYKLVTGLNLEPYVLDINSNVMSKVISAAYTVGEWKLEDFGTIAVVDFGSMSTNVMVFDKKVMKLNKLIDGGTAQVLESISNTFGLDFDGARQKMIDDVHLDDSESEEVSANLLSDVAKEGLEKTCDQIQMVLKYYMSRESNKEFDGLIIYGGGAKLQGIDKYMENYFKIPLVNVDINEHVNVTKKGLKIDSKIYTNALGALLGR
jgi:type IV pilus assembly protein PilM